MKTMYNFQNERGQLQTKQEIKFLEIYQDIEIFWRWEYSKQ